MYKIERSDDGDVVVTDLVGNVILRGNEEDWIVYSDRYDSVQSASKLKDLTDDVLLMALANIVELKPVK